MTAGCVEDHPISVALPSQPLAQYWPFITAPVPPPSTCQPSAPPAKSGLVMRFGPVPPVPGPPVVPAPPLVPASPVVPVVPAFPVAPAAPVVAAAPVVPPVVPAAPGPPTPACPPYLGRGCSQASAASSEVPATSTSKLRRISGANIVKNAAGRNELGRPRRISRRGG